jgi:cytochrome P450
VASWLAGTFFYLSRYPSVYRRLAAEIRTAFTRPDDIRHGPTLSSCTYLRACLDETLRISPPTNVTLWRDAPHDVGTNPLIIDGHRIPPGTRIGVNIYAIHHNEAYFAEPFTYRPERWLPAESGLSEEETKIMHSAFMPFSKGARNCAGIPVAYAEASMVVAETLWRFDFERSKDDTESAEKGRELVFRMEDIAGSKHSGPLLNFRAREVHVK